MRLRPFFETRLASAIGQLRAAPVSLGPGKPPAILAVYCADFDVDPYVEMFFFPREQLKMALLDASGGVLWRKVLGKGVVPGVWFCPVFPFDLDGDGVDEIWYVGNSGEKHPLGISRYTLERLDPRTGEPAGSWPWPQPAAGQDLSGTFRNFIAGGRVRGEPVLVTAQGTYGTMLLEGWSRGMHRRWDRVIGLDAAGARGSHMCPVVDLDGDGVEELMWGERSVELDRGTELFCADRDAYRGHSDVVQPFLDRAAGRWLLYTCRESQPKVAPRVAVFDARGGRVWGAVDRGHMDMGWVARLGENRDPRAMAIRIGGKTCGPDGRFHQDPEEFGFDPVSGSEWKPGFSAYRTIPVDLTGDGYHELVRGTPGSDGEVLDREGNILGSVGGPVALAAKVTDRPGEQLLTYSPDGWVRLWGDAEASDGPEALERYAHPFYAANRRLTAVGYNLVNLGGI